MILHRDVKVNYEKVESSIRLLTQQIGLLADHTYEAVFEVQCNAMGSWKMCKDQESHP